jgi:hypothetical protein
LVATLVTVEAGRVAKVEHVALDVVRWTRVEIDVSSLATIEDVSTATGSSLGEALDGAEGRTLAARIVLSGETQLHRALKLKAARLEAEAARAAGDIWLEGIELKTVGKAITASADEAVAALAAEAELMKDGSNDHLRVAVEALPKKFTAALRREAGLETIDDAMIAAIIDDARDMLLAKLGS